MKDYMVRGIDENGVFRVFVANTTNLVNEAQKTHFMSATATAALGRTLTACVIMGTMMKNEKDTVSIQIVGDGPIKTVLAVANSKGQVKGYVGNPAVDLPLRSDGKLDVGGAIGRNGRIIVIKDLGLKDPYIGQSKLVSGEIAEDLAHYFAYSEQQPSAVNLGVLVDTDLSVKAAGGYIVEMLPNAKEEEIVKLEKNINQAEPISTLIDRGYKPEDIVSEVFKDFNIEILDQKQLMFKCDCSREKVKNVLYSLGKDEIDNIIKEEGKAEVECYFCNKKYSFGKEELIKIFNS